MTDTPEEVPPAGVPDGATQAGEVRARWAWTEPGVWTERMLTALEHGVNGGRWYALIDKVYAPATLRAAFAQVKANAGAAGVDHQTVAMFDARLDDELARLSRELRDGTYRPRPVRRHGISKGERREQRPLGIPPVRDRVVQAAVRVVLEPIFDRDFAAHSYGFRPKRGCKNARRRVVALLAPGYTVVVDVDIQQYFDSMPHALLLGRVRAKVSDGRVLALLEQFLEQDVMEGLVAWTPDEGTPQGAVISPLLANIYLDPLDHVMAAAGVELVRYADDAVVLCRTAAEAARALTLLRTWTEAAGLRLHPQKTRVVDATQPGGFDVLGYHFEQGKRWPRKKSLQTLKDALRAKTRRANGQSLAVIIAGLNPVLRGWFEDFKHSHRTTFPPLDSWVRMRLRSILRKRTGRRGRGRGADHQRWPNAFFAAHGLFTLTTARASAVSPRMR